MLRPLLLVVFLLAPASASTQVRGLVTDDRGLPLPSAAVVIWGLGELLEETATDAAGRFESAVQVASIRRISVHYLGFATAIIDGRAAGAGDVQVGLVPLPLALPEVAVSITSDICDDEEDAVARRLWNAARSRYAQDTGMRAGLIAGFGKEGDVRSDALATIDADGLAPWGRRWPAWNPGSPVTALLGAILERRPVDSMYAWQPEPGRTSQRHLNWSYPLFEERDAYHFVTEEFGEAHTFHLLPDGSAARLAFCPRSASRPGLQGHLSLAADTTFSFARWAVATRGPRENAGGEVVFTDVLDSAGARHLVAARGIFWRHDGREPQYPGLPRTYHQTVRLNHTWIISVEPEMPDCRGLSCAF